jgi:hypothetical protein
MSNHTSHISPPPIAPKPPVAPAQRVWVACATRMPVIFGVFVASTVIVLLGDWLAHWSYMRSWLQISASLAAILVCFAAFGKPGLERLDRLLLGFASFAILGAVIDSLDGRQDFVPLMSIPLALCSGVAAQTTIAIWRSQSLKPWHRSVGTAVGFLTATIYIALTVSSVATARGGEAATFATELFATYGLVAIALLRWIGNIYPPAPALQGRVRRCMHCNLLNIPERNTCKRCGSVLGGIEVVQ